MVISVVILVNNEAFGFEFHATDVSINWAGSWSHLQRGRTLAQFPVLFLDEKIGEEELEEDGWKK